MVSILQLQTRTEASAAAAATRRIFAVRQQEEEEEEFEFQERMDLSGTQGELPIPMHAAVSPYAGMGSHGGGGGGGGGHVMELHHHEHVGNNGQAAQAIAMASPPIVAVAEQESSPVAAKKRGSMVVGGGGGGAGGGVAVKYRECLKNHAAAIGGNATDGCGEFMPSGEEGSLEALKCSACGCHRNFHRKDVDDFDGDSCSHGSALRGARHLLGPAVPHHHHHHKNGSGGGLLVAGDPYGAAYAAARALPPPPPPPPHGQGHHHHHHQIIMPLNMIHTSESDEMDGSGAMGGAGRGGGGSSSSSKKRFRTKFTAEQKARMLDFAERVGWRLQKLDDAMVQHFCQEIGVKRRVLKVWMHNNKHNLAKKPLPSSPPPPQIPMSMPPSPPPMPMPPSHPPSPPQLKLE